MLYADGGSTHVEYGAAFGEEIDGAYRARAYHNFDDEFSYDWDFDALARDARLMGDVGQRIANSSDWPNWYDGNEFRALRDAMMAGDDADAGDSGEE